MLRETRAMVDRGWKIPLAFPAYDLIRSTPSEHRALLSERLEKANMNYTTGIIWKPIR